MEVRLDVNKEVLVTLLTKAALAGLIAFLSTLVVGMQGLTE